MGAGLGSTKRPLCSRTALSSLAIVLAAFSVSCGRTSYDVSDNAAGGSAGMSAGAAGNGPTGGGVSIGSGGGGGVIVIVPGGSGPTLPDPNQTCANGAGAAKLFVGRTVAGDAPARRELFTWTTSEQADEIREGRVLLTRTERPGMGPGFAMEALAQVGKQAGGPNVTPEAVELAQLLSGPSFSKARYAWSEPWATRAGWPGESYGDQLVRILLREDAYLARFRNGTVDVVDMDNQPVDPQLALAQPERIAGVYFVRDATVGGPDCRGSFFGGGSGYREFIIGNAAMIEEWSIGTPEIRARLEQDIALLQAFYDRVLPCPSYVDASSWNINVGCRWESGGPLNDDEVSFYEAALAIPNENYLPSPAPLLSLLDLLKSSLFEPDPLVVRSGE